MKDCIVFEDLGLDSDAEAVYRAMLTHREWGVSRICESLQLSDSQVRSALDRLAELTLARPSLDVPGQFRPVSPDLGLTLLLRRQQAEVRQREHKLARAQAAVSELIVEHAAGRDGAVIGAERLNGLDAIQSRLEELAHQSTTECLSLMPGGGQSEASLTASRPLDELMLRRGNSVLTVYLDSVRNDPATLKYARWLTESGGAVRTTPVLPLRMVLFDRMAALVPIDPDDTRRGAIQLRGAGVIAALLALFEQLWVAATPLGQAAMPDPIALTGPERELLRLLAQGLTDEVAARRLGVSLRTTRRMMASIMRRLGAHSRFEAGLRAQERNWLSP